MISKKDKTCYLPKDCGHTSYSKTQTNIFGLYHSYTYTDQTKD